MNQVKRDEYCFLGPKAEESGKYYDAVLSHGYDGDMCYLAWDAAHKFGTKMVGNKIASFRNGITIGTEALAAAEFIDEEYQKAFASCEEFGRSKRMRELMRAVYALAEQRYAVEVKFF